MELIRKTLGALGLAAVFIFLSIFSLTEYQDNKIATGAQDKIPVVAQVFNKLGLVMAYLGQVPLLRLVPVASVSNNYQQTIGGVLTENKISGIDFSKPVTINSFKDWWLSLKANMQKEDWSRR